MAKEKAKAQQPRHTPTADGLIPGHPETCECNQCLNAVVNEELARAEPCMAAGLRRKHPRLSIGTQADMVRLSQEVIRQGFARSMMELAVVPLAKKGEKFSHGRTAPWHDRLRPHLLKSPDAVHHTGRLIEVLRGVTNVKVVTEETTVCIGVDRNQACSRGIHIHYWLDSQDKTETVSLDQIQRFARSLFPSR